MTDQDNQKFVELIKSYEPTSRNIEFVEHGYHNIVAIVDKKLVFRFPRDEKAQYWLMCEALILQAIDGQLPKTPKCLHLSSEPVYSIQNYLPGKHLTEEELADLTSENRRQITAELIEFIINYDRFLSPAKLMSIQKQSGLTDSDMDENWADYLEKTLGQALFPGHLDIEKLAKRYYRKWLEVTASDNLPKITLHDDLHLHNLLFKDGQINGILDFGGSTIGTVTEEMRNFFKVSENFLAMAIANYAKQTSQRVDPEKVKIWAITTELASLCKRLSANMTDSPGFIRAQKNLKKWGVIENNVAG